MTARIEDGSRHSDDRTARVLVADVYEEYFEFVWRSLRRLGVQDEDLRDAAHDVFLVVCLKFSSFEGRSSRKTWLFGIALRVAKRHRHQRRGVPTSDAEVFDPRGGPERGAQMVEAVEIVQQILDEIGDDHRAVFVMAELEEMTAPEVAAVLHVPVNTVYSKLRLARAAFENALNRRKAKDGWKTRATL